LFVAYLRLLLGRNLLPLGGLDFASAELWLLYHAINIENFEIVYRFLARWSDFPQFLRPLRNGAMKLDRGPYWSVVVARCQYPSVVKRDKPTYSILLRFEPNPVRGLLCTHFELVTAIQGMRSDKIEWGHMDKEG
jgi:hypothetical protein